MNQRQQMSSPYFTRNVESVLYPTSPGAGLEQAVAHVFRNSSPANCRGFPSAAEEEGRAEGTSDVLGRRNLHFATTETETQNPEAETRIRSMAIANYGRDPAEQVVHGVIQTEVNGAHGLDFARAACHLLRQDPQVLVIGEIREERSWSNPGQPAKMRSTASWALRKLRRKVD